MASTIWWWQTRPTDEQFGELKQFVEEAQFERMGVFPYSYEPDTPAIKLDGHLPEEVKNERRDELMALQQEIAFEYGDSLVGSEIDVLIDEQLEEGIWVGRGYMDAPEIDSAWARASVPGHSKLVAASKALNVTGPETA